MKDASQALNSGLVFSSSSRKCQVFKMIYCHAVRWEDGRLGNGLREGRVLGSVRGPGSPLPPQGVKTKMFLKLLCQESVW